MKNIIIQCKDCGKEFVFTAKEQRFYAAKGFESGPVRCEDCRRQKRQVQSAKDAHKKHYFETVCAACGAPARIPFVPKGDKPAFCSKCKTANENELTS